MVKAISITTLVHLAAMVSLYLFWYKPKFSDAGKGISVSGKLETSHATLLRINNKVAELKKYDKQGTFNKQYCFLIDMSIHSGRNRFFIYNLLKDSVVASGLVTHGRGTAAKNNQLQFSNTVSSNCTSLGRYRVGKPYMGKFGLAYKLHGLDKTNSRAFERFVVLHAHDCVPNSEVFPLPICESLGCPTVSPAFLTILKKYISVQPNPSLCGFTINV